MKWSSSVFVAVLVLAWPQAPANAEGSIKVPQCVAVRSEARAHEHGFDHVVYVRNACPVAVQCVVSTTRDPEPSHRLMVPAGEEKGVVTRTRATRPDFEPTVSCERRARARLSGPHGS